MPETKKTEACSPAGDRPTSPPAFFDPDPVRKGVPRVSRMGRRRALVLVLVHLAIFLHILHWKLAGKTVSPLEPSEAMYTVAEGVVNAGALLLLASIASVLVLGRWFCGWACHLVAVQDGAAWLLKKVGIRPRPLRSRALAFVPLAAGLYLYGLPLFVRIWHEIGLPDFFPGLMKTAFWETFPGFWLGLITFVFTGGVMVYLLGAKGFCTYACPYGGLFGVADRLAPARIRVTDACKGCGHCSAVCTSNVRVADEVARYRMVVDPGCMKCLDCISVCPENALYFGFGKPAVLARPRSARRWSFPYGWKEELALATLFALGWPVFAGLPRDFFPWADKLYGRTPLLLATGLAATNAFILLHGLRLILRKDENWAGHPLRTAGRWTAAGRSALVVFVLWIAFFLHSGWMQFETWRGNRAFQAIPVAELAWDQEKAKNMSDEMRDRVDTAESALHRAERFGLVPDLRLSTRLASLSMIHGDRRQAIRWLEHARDIDPGFAPTWFDLASLYATDGRPGQASEAARRCYEIAPDGATYGIPHRTNYLQSLSLLSQIQADQGQFMAAYETLERFRAIDPENALVGQLMEELKHLAQQPDGNDR